MAGKNLTYEFRPFSFRDGSYLVKFSYSNAYDRVVRSNISTGAQIYQLLPNSDGEFVGSDYKHFAFHASPFAAGGTTGKVSCWVVHSIEPYYVGARNIISNAGTEYIQAAYASDLGSTDPVRGCAFFGKNFTCGGNLNS